MSRCIRPRGVTSSLALALGLLATSCSQTNTLAAATGGSLAAEIAPAIAALAELQSAGSMTAEEFSAAKQGLIAGLGGDRRQLQQTQHTQFASSQAPEASQPHDGDTPRRLQQGGAPLPPPSGACPDVTGLQQALDAATARVAALEVYTDVSAAPRGLIAMWSGAAETVPQGWALCDGASGTPDLRDKFVVGAGPRYALGTSADTGENVGASAPTVRTARTTSLRQSEPERCVC